MGATPLIGAIWAQTPDGVIGRDGGMPWHLPEDLAHFKRVTGGHPVIMGRRTWESFPERFRPLPGRTNVVITSHPQEVLASGGPRPGPAGARDDGTAVVTVSTWAQAVAAARAAPGAEEIWVIGGGRLYREAMADETAPVRRAVVTVIDLDQPGDTWAPGLGASWRLIERGPQQCSRTGPSWHVEVWDR